MSITVANSSNTPTGTACGRVQSDILQLQESNAQRFRKGYLCNAQERTSTEHALQPCIGIACLRAPHTTPRFTAPHQIVRHDSCVHESIKLNTCHGRRTLHNRSLCCFCTCPDPKGACNPRKVSTAQIQGSTLGTDTCSDNLRQQCMPHSPV